MASSSDGGEAWCGDTYESCTWDGQGVCYEFMNQSGVELWCSAMGDTYGFDVTYSWDRCASATRGSCDGLTGGDFGALTVYAAYFEDFPGDPEAACAEAGGVYAP